MRNRLVIGLFTLAALQVCPSAAAASCPPGENLADRDGDGLADYACVGDWDLSGACEMREDIQTAIDSLSDPGPKRVELSDCSFAPPVLSANEKGIIELPSNLTLAGQGPATVLNGFSEFDVTSLQSVVTNRHDGVVGASNVTIRDLTIDGGWRTGNSDSLPTHFRMGVFFDECDDCLVEDITVTDTLHSCLYARDSTGVKLLNSTLRRCGNSEGTGVKAFSCVYLFATPGKIMQDTLVMGIDCERSGWAALNTRRWDETATVRNLVFRNNSVRNVKIVDGVQRNCIMIRGVDNVLYENTTCINTGGVTTHAATAYYSDGTDRESSANITIDGLHLVDTHRMGLLVQEFVENFTGRNITIDNTPDHHCMQFQGPQRGFLLEDTLLANCGRRGISEFGIVGTGVEPDDRMVFRRISVRGAGSDTAFTSGILFNGPATRLTLDRIDIDGTTGHGIEFAGPAEGLIVQDSSVVNVPFSGISVRDGCRDCTFEGNWVEGVAGDGLRLDGPSGANPTLGNITIRDNAFAAIDMHALAFAPGSAIENVAILRNTIDGTGGDGIDLELDAAEPSAAIEILGNTVRDFGQDGGWSRGIDVSGFTVDAIVAGNAVEAPANQPATGIRFDVPNGDASHLCYNTCGGGLTTDTCLDVPGDPAYSSDQDGDGVPDACGNACPSGTDLDGDGWCVDFDNCPGMANPTQEDADQDGVGDICDVCPFVHDPDQEDTDGGIRGDACPANPNLIANGGFETGSLSPWEWFSDTLGTATVNAGAAEVQTIAIGTDTEFFQNDICISGGTRYRLELDATCSNNGGECGAPDLPDIALLLHRHEAQPTNYGLSWNIALSPFLRTFSTEFDVPAELPPLKSARLQIGFVDFGLPGNIYRFDRVILTKVPLCGDEAVDNGEECDDGNVVDDDACRNDCSLAVCGDGFLRPGLEECDDGNSTAGDGCEADCTFSCRDSDGDGHGFPGNPFCAAGAEKDCDDVHPDVYPGASQACDGSNNNCNALGWPDVPPDETDVDADGFYACQGDCNDTNADVNPLGAEVCNGVDDDCNGLIDDDGSSDDDDDDTVFNMCDNCVSVRNTSQSDLDDDGVGDACDLDDGLIFVTVNEVEAFVWQHESGFETWNIYRGDLDTLRDTGLYTQLPAPGSLVGRECNLATPLAGDTIVPDPGKVAFYLVSGSTGGLEGSLGSDSTGTPRPNDHACRSLDLLRRTESWEE